MKLSGLLAGAVAALGVTAAASAANAATAFDTAVLGTSSLLGYYTFTAAAGADDVSSNAHTGTLVNGATVGGAGPFTGARSLVLDNGASGAAYSTAGGASPLQGGIDQSGSLIAWIDLASLPSLYNRIYSIVGESQVGNDFDLQINNDNRLSFYTDGGSSTQYLLDGAAMGQWLFIAATFNANGARTLYINGAQVATSTAGGHSANAAPFYVGQSNVFGGRYFDGDVSDVAIFSGALTAPQISHFYDARLLGSGSPEPESWALMLLGLGGIGAMARSRRRFARA